MTAPPLIVTACIGACGKTNRTARASGKSSSGTIGSKSCPSAPRPCSQITAAVGDGPVSSSSVCSTGSAHEGVEHPLEETLDMRLIDPAHHDHQIVVGIDPDQAASRAAGCPGARFTDVQPPEQAVIRIDRARSPALVDP